MLRAFFDENNPIMQALSAAADLIVLNLLAILCALPLITAGASYAALCTACRNLVRNEDGYLLRDFFRGFRANLRDGCTLGTVLLFCTLVLLVDYRLAAENVPLLRIAVGAAGFVLLAVSLYAFPLLSRYDQPLRTIVKNAALLSVGYFPRTAGMLLCTAGLWFLGTTVPMLTVLLPLFGLSLPCYVCALLCDPVLDRLEGKDGADGQGKTVDNAEENADCTAKNADCTSAADDSTGKGADK